MEIEERTDHGRRRVRETPSLEAGSYGDRDTRHCTVQSVATGGEKRKKEHLSTSVIVNGATFRLYSKHTGLLWCSPRVHVPALSPSPLPEPPPSFDASKILISFSSLNTGSLQRGWTSWLAQAASSVLPLRPRGLSILSFEDDTWCIFQHRPKNNDLLTVDTS